jgi:hypothetical protein
MGATPASDQGRLCRFHEGARTGARRRSPMSPERRLEAFARAGRPRSPAAGQRSRSDLRR